METEEERKGGSEESARAKGRSEKVRGESAGRPREKNQKAACLSQYSRKAEEGEE